MRSFPCFRIPTLAICLLAAALAAPLARASDEARRYIVPRSNADNPPGYAFSNGVLVGNTLYLSGHLGLDANNQIPADPEAEARLVLDQIKATVVTAGLTMDDIVMLQITCTDLSLYGRFNAIYKTYFTKEFPARAFLGTDKLLFGARFEVLGIAVKR